MLIPFDIPEALETGFSTTGTSGSGKTQLVKRLVKFLIDQGIIVWVYDTSQAWNINSPINYVKTFESPITTNDFYLPERNTIFDISRLKIIERFKFVDATCEGIMIFRKNHSNPERLPWIFLVWEESQIYLPNGCMRSLKKYGNVVDVVTVGRNFKVRFGLITQFPAMVDKNPIKITQQRYFGWTSEKNDLSYIRSFLTKDQENDLRKQLGITDKKTIPLAALGKMRFIYQFQGKSKVFDIEPYGTTEQPKQGFSYNYNLIYAT